VRRRGRRSAALAGEDEAELRALALGARDLHAADGGMEIARTEGEGTQFCLVLTRKRG